MPKRAPPGAAGRSRKRNQKVLTERKSEAFKLPKLDSAYLQHPGEGTTFKKVKVRRDVLKEVNKYSSQICGTCGAKHAPDEPHRTRNSASIISTLTSSVSKPPKAPSARPKLNAQVLESNVRYHYTEKKQSFNSIDHRSTST